MSGNWKINLCWVTWLAAWPLLGAISLLLPSCTEDYGRIRADQRNEVKNVTNAISMYRMEYGRSPAPVGTESDTNTATSGDLLKILSGYNVGDLNPREKVFYEGKRAKRIKGEQPRNGVFENPDTGELSLFDPYGRTFTVVFDRGYDGSVTDPRTGETINKSAIVFGHGKDLSDISDDILSWK